MPGTFDIQEEVISAICNYPMKAIAWMEANLTQTQLDDFSVAVLPELSAADKAQRLYRIGRDIKLVGIADVAKATEQSVETIETMLTKGTAVATMILEQTNTVQPSTPSEPTPEPAPEPPAAP